MFYRALDFLACPRDKTTFSSVNDEKSEKTPFAVKSIPCHCSSYCGFLKRNVEMNFDYPCFECSRKWIVSGTLYCEKCGTTYFINDGIPDLMARIEGDSGHDDPKESELYERDRTAAVYDSKFPPGRDLAGNDALLSALDLNETDTVLELGSGTGRQSIQILPLCREIACLDFSMESLRLALDKYRDNPCGWLHAVRADICSIPISEAHKFNKIFSFEVIQHIPKELKHDLLKEIDQYLAVSGTFVVVVYNHSSKTIETVKKEGYHLGRIYFYRYNHRELRDYLNEVFSVERVNGIIILPTHKFIGSLTKIGLGRIALSFERFAENTCLSYCLGELLLATCKKRIN